VVPLVADADIAASEGVVVVIDDVVGDVDAVDEVNEVDVVDVVVEPEKIRLVFAIVVVVNLR
jgi:hypothetical protein